MYSKLVKYEFKSLSRWIVPFYLILLAMTIFTKCINSIDYLTDNLPIFCTSVTVLYYITVIALIILTVLFVVFRFYQNLLTGEGYLMFTLPVSIKQLIISKSAVAYLFTLISFIGSIVSMFIINNKDVTYDGDWYHIENNSFQTLINKIGKQNCVSTILLFMVFIALQLLFFYLCIAIGQLFSNKLLGAVLAYVGIYNAFQVITLVFFFIGGFFVADKEYILSNLYIIFSIGIIIALVLCYICYHFTYHLLKNKLNLE